jgi:5-methylcytosine-specific restriction endonuclease McrA
MDATLAGLVRERARSRCEYCRLPEAFSAIPFEIDHIVAQKHGGPTREENLALSCFYCNR